jgi:hypothetical protein
MMPIISKTSFYLFHHCFAFHIVARIQPEVLFNLATRRFLLGLCCLAACLELPVVQVSPCFLLVFLAHLLTPNPRRDKAALSVEYFLGRFLLKKERLDNLQSHFILPHHVRIMQGESTIGTSA